MNYRFKLIMTLLLSTHSGAVFSGNHSSSLLLRSQKRVGSQEEKGVAVDEKRELRQEKFTQHLSPLCRTTTGKNFNINIEPGDTWNGFRNQIRTHLDAGLTYPNPSEFNISYLGTKLEKPQDLEKLEGKSSQIFIAFDVKNYKE